jgi:hypothetical protein
MERYKEESREGRGKEKKKKKRKTKKMGEMVGD